jgi:hypothetical protein
VKTPDAPRAYPKLTELPEPEEKGDKMLPRYVHIPALRQQGFGPRNLFWGVAALFLALVLLAVALLLTGSKAVVSLAICLLTFTALFVLARMHVFRQRNGGFFALALVCLLGAAIPLLETAFAATKNFVAQRNSAAPAVTPTPAAAPTTATAPLLTESFALAKPAGPGRQVRVIKDSTVLIREKPFLVKAGETFPFIESSVGETTFAVRDLQLSLPSGVVEVIDPQAVAKGVSGGAPAEPSVATNAPPKTTAEELAEVTKIAQQEAIRRYPALAIKDSLENEAFVSTFSQLKAAGSGEFFENPEWPLELAELLAKREGWQRGGGPMTTGPAPVLDPPSAPLPVDGLDAGTGLPRGVR